MAAPSRIVVTGGTGFLGQHLCQALVAAGHTVRVVARGALPRTLGKLPLERHELDLSKASIDDLERALDGATDLIHAAGFVSRAPADGPRMMRLHVDGTRQLLAAVDRSAVRNVVLVSTSGTIAVSRTPTPLLDESAPAPIELVGAWPYYLSKIYEERLFQSWAKRAGRRTVIVNPSLLLGPGDDRNSSTTDIFNILRGKIPVVPKGGLSFVDARDAAAVVMRALADGEDGQRYLVGAVNWTFEEFLGRTARLAKVEPPRLQLPTKLVSRATRLLEHAYDFAGRTAPFDSVSVAMSDLYWYTNSARAAERLGFSPRDPQETLDETISDVRRRML